MVIFSNLIERARSVLVWCGDEAHRRFVVGAIAGVLGIVFHKEVDSTFVDCVVMLVGSAILAAWSPATVKAS